MNERAERLVWRKQNEYRREQSGGAQLRHEQQQYGALGIADKTTDLINRTTVTQPTAQAMPGICGRSIARQAIPTTRFKSMC